MRWSYDKRTAVLFFRAQSSARFGSANMKSLLILLLVHNAISVPTNVHKHWKLTNSKVYANRIPIERWESQRTGLTITLAKPENPMVNGYFCAPTEARDGDGIPHVLEHLIFQGR